MARAVQGISGMGALEPGHAVGKGLNWEESSGVGRSQVALVCMVLTRPRKSQEPVNGAVECLRQGDENGCSWGTLAGFQTGDRALGNGGPCSELMLGEGQVTAAERQPLPKGLVHKSPL